MRIKPRLKIGIGTIGLAVIGLVAGLVVPATTASANTIPKGVWNYIWKPGTPLPKIAAGEKLVAWPVLAPGAPIPKVPAMVPIATANASGRVAETASAATIRSVTGTTAGTVNLLAEPQGCVPPKQISVGKNTTGVGQAYSRTTVARLQFSYTHGQGTALEVGISANGTNGWSVDGTVAIGGGGSATEYFGTQNHVSFDRYNSWFQYVKYYNECASKEGSDYYYSVVAREWAAGVQYFHPRHPPKYSKDNCVQQPKGTGLNVISSSAVTFSAGFSAFGFLGSSHTGYDTNASIDVTFPYGAGWLCGEYDYPGGTPGVLIAQLHDTPGN
jgi:hypothetical protein